MNLKKKWYKILKKQHFSFQNLKKSITFYSKVATKLLKNSEIAKTIFRVKLK